MGKNPCQHVIPLGTMVTVNCHHAAEHGLRLFVSRYTMNEYGEPLYGVAPFNITAEKSVFHYLDGDMLHLGDFMEDELVVVPQPTRH